MGVPSLQDRFIFRISNLSKFRGAGFFFAIPAAVRNTETISALSLHKKKT